MNRSYRYRLYPNRVQEQALDFLLGQGRRLYNAALQERKDVWQKCSISINYYAQANQLKDIRSDDPDGIGKLNFSACQQILRRLDKAFKAFFRRVKAGEKPGYPRFKSKSRFRSLVFRFGDGATFSNSRLRIQNVGKIKVKWHRPIPLDAQIKAVVVKRNGFGHWYAICQLELPDAQPFLNGQPAVGLDLGISSLVALSNGELIESPHWFRQSQGKLRRQQRRVSRRKKFSNRWRKACRQVARTHAKIVNQRDDFLHKLSHGLVNKYGFIAVEDLNINGLAKSNLAKGVHDASWGKLIHVLAYKAAEAGCQIVSINPYNTSQVCSSCGCIVKKDLGVRMHDCPHCGLVLDRDVNAARNILHRALNSVGRTDQALTWPVAACVA